MRKIVYNTLIPDSGESLLSGFYNQRTSNQFSDARENPSLHAFKVGNPQGTVDVPGKRGWIYMQRMLPGGDSVTLQCFVPSTQDGETTVKFQADTAFTPRRTNDTNPTYWLYDGIPPSTKVDQQICSDTDVGGCGPAVPAPCHPVDYSGSQCRPVHRVLRTIPCCIPNEITGCDPCANQYDEPPDYVYGTNPLDIQDLGQQISGYCGGGGGTFPPTNSTGWPNDYDYGNGDAPTDGHLPYIGPTGTSSSGDGGFAGSNPIVTPVYSPQPPPVPTANQLWFDGQYTRRWIGPTDVRPNGWEIIQGPKPGTYFDAKFVDATLYGTAMYKVNDTFTDSKYDKAVATDTTTYGKVVGIAIKPTIAANKLGIIQTEGIAAFSTSLDPGTRLFIGDNGRPTDVVPATGSGKIVQQIGTVLNAHEIMIQIGTPILRA